MNRSVLTSSVCVALIGALFVICGVKNYTVFQHAVQYRLMITGEQKATAEASNAQSGEAVRDTGRRVAERIAWAPRYYVFHPSFEIADFLGMDVANIYPFQIVLFLALFAGLIVNLGLRFGAVQSTLGLVTVALLSVAVFSLMNGRAAPAFLGYAILAWSATVSSSNDSLLRHVVLSSVGLVLCTMSSGLFLVALTFFILCNLTPLGDWLIGSAPPRNDSGAKRAFNILIAFCGLLYAAVLIYRIGDFYGWDERFVTGALTHGAGALVGALSLQAVLVTFAICIVAGVLLLNSSQVLPPLKRGIANHRAVLLVSAVPLPFVVVGYTGATLTLVGGILLAAYAAEYLVRIARDRAGELHRSTQSLGITSKTWTL